MWNFHSLTHTQTEAQQSLRESFCAWILKEKVVKWLHFKYQNWVLVERCTLLDSMEEQSADKVSTKYRGQLRRRLTQQNWFCVTKKNKAQFSKCLNTKEDEMSKITIEKKKQTKNHTYVLILQKVRFFFHSKYFFVQVECRSIVYARAIEIHEYRPSCKTQAKRLREREPRQSSALSDFINKNEAHARKTFEQKKWFNWLFSSPGVQWHRHPKMKSQQKSLRKMSKNRQIII